VALNNGTGFKGGSEYKRRAKRKCWLDSDGFKMYISARTLIMHIEHAVKRTAMALEA
jgi:hypothetical protein